MTEIDDFVTRWAASGAAERANYGLFLTELCDLLGVERPHPKGPDEHENAYVFEKPVPLPQGSTGRIDLYKRGCFVLEAKQGSDQPAPADPLPGERRGPRKRGHGTRGTAAWDTAMERAREQAQGYARALPARGRGGPPALRDRRGCGSVHRALQRVEPQRRQLCPLPRSRQLPNQARRPARPRHPRAAAPRVGGADLARPGAAQRRRHARDCGAAGTPRPLAGRGARAGKRSRFLMRCLFTMFAEDVGLLPKRAFTTLLDDLHRDPASFAPMLEHLWGTMNTGGFSVILRQQIPRFNGGLFAEQRALPLDAAQIQLLIEAAGPTGATWSPPSSAPCWSAPSTRASATSWARTTRRAPTSSGWCCRRSWSRCARSGRAAQAAGARAWRTRDEARRGAGRGVERFHQRLCHAARARPGLRLRQLPLRHARAPEAPGRRGAGRCSRELRQAQGCWSWQGATVTPAAAARHRGEPARGRHRRPGALDRLPPMAPAHARRARGAARADPPERPQHRVPRRRARVGRARAAARRARASR